MTLYPSKPGHVPIAPLLAACSAVKDMLYKLLQRLGGSGKNMAANPFQPGSGQMPPLLAGRDAVKTDINRTLQYLRAPARGAPSDIILDGPSGNGKTVLLQWLQQHCTADLGYTVCRITPSSAMSLKEQLVAAVGAAPVQVGIVEEAHGQRVLTESLDNYLIRQARQNPLVLLVDEAHTMPVEWGRELLNTSQRVRQSAPFLLLLAGPPGLHAHLSTLGASFWMFSKMISLGLPNAAATAAAIVQPLRQGGITLAPEVLSQVVAASQCYPCFIQLWGQALWRAAKNAQCTCIEPPLLAVAARDFNGARDALYQQYWVALQQQQVAAAALLIAQAFHGRQSIADRQLRSIVAGRPVHLDQPKEILATIGKLLHLSFIWQGGASTDWHPAIPGLMPYIVSQAQQLTLDNGDALTP